MDPNAFKYIAVAAMSIGLLGAALSISGIFSALMNAIARNPSTQDKLVGYALIGAALAEAMGIFALAIAMILIFK